MHHAICFFSNTWWLKRSLWKKTVLLISLFGLGIDYLFLFFAPTLWWLFIGRIIAGICGASFSTAGAYIADISPPEKRAQNFGMIGAAFGLGFIIGPLLGSVFSQFGVRMPFMVAAVLSLLNWAYGYLFYLNLYQKKTVVLSIGNALTL
jgi:DHA1 family tetracycline resistance protein-like MFS transporter